MEAWICTKCGVEKPLTVEYFNTRSDSKTGFRSYCRECYAAAQHAIYERDKEKRHQYNVANADRRRAREAEYRSRSDGASGSQACKDCAREFSLTAKNFAPSGKYSNGFNSRCRECQAAFDSAAYEADKERRLVGMKVYAAEHAKEIREYHAQYYVENKETLLEKNRQWRAENAERARETSRQYYADHREEMRESNRRWRIENRDRKNESERRRRALKQSLTIVPFAVSLLDQKWAYWGGKCWMCGRNADTWDHVKPLAKGGYHCLANLRPACRHCNSSKQAKWPLPELRLAA